MSHLVLLYYQFAKVSDPEGLAASTRADCQDLGLRGRIIIAEEGINGTVSGPSQACQKHMESLRMSFPDIEFKIDETAGHVFKGLSVKVRDEIITMGVPLGTPVHQRTGRHLSPEEWREAIQQDDVVLLDGRNDYESELGHFEGALLPPLESFRDFPAWILAHREQLEGKRILTYCTGGIRCEKLSAWMLQEGFEEVYQLDGGIVRYGKETDGAGFVGMNVVFDDRVLVPPTPAHEPITHCRECNAKSANYVNCANVLCNRRMILCPGCEESTSRCCSDECRDAPSLREKNAKLRA